MTVVAVLMGLMTIAFAFSVGFATRRASVCAVAAAQQSVLQGRHDRLASFVGVMCWSGLILLPAASLVPDVVHLSPGYPVTFSVVAGGILFGLGAYINGACAFGTLSYLAGGDLNYVGTLIGIFIGAALAATLPEHFGSPAEAAVSLTTVLGLLTFSTFAGVGGFSLLKLLSSRKSRARNGESSGTVSALLVIAVCGALLHATAGEWTYMAVLSERAASLVTGHASHPAPLVFVGAIALIAGGIYAARRSERFAWQRPKPIAISLRGIGGAVMGFAAAIVPGGNDVMLIYGLPSAAPHAIAAYLSMMASLFAVLAITKWFAPPCRSGFDR